MNDSSSGASQDLAKLGRDDGATKSPRTAASFARNLSRPPYFCRFF
ncbi:hypothetical protein [Methylobacterium oryzisoli]